MKNNWNKEITKSSILIMASKIKVPDTNNFIEDVILIPIKLIYTGIYHLHCKIRPNMIYKFKLDVNINDSTIYMHTQTDLNIIGSFPCYDIYKDGEHVSHIFCYLNGNIEDDNKYLELDIDYNDEVINIIDIVTAEYEPESIGLYSEKIVNILIDSKIIPIPPTHLILDGKYIQYNGEE